MSGKHTSLTSLNLPFTFWNEHNEFWPLKRMKNKTGYGVDLETDDSRPLFEPASLRIIFGLAMATAVALGFARFAYALLLPAMHAELAWSYAEAGAVNTANAIGYLVGAMGATDAVRRLGMRRTFAMGLLVTTFSVGASGVSDSYLVLMVLRFLAGMSGALAFVVGAVLVATASGKNSRAPLVLGIYFSGAGAGIAISAVVVPYAMELGGWRGGWLALGLLSLLASCTAAWAAARVPEMPAGGQAEVAGHFSPRTISIELIGYALFGAGYIAYATFIVAYLRGAQGFTPAEITLFWAALGLSAIVGAFVWGPVLARLRGGWGAAATISVVMIGVVLPILVAGRAPAYFSAVLFGSSFLAVIAAVSSFARRAVPPGEWSAAIGALTIAFGIGQCIGPVLSGYLSDGPDGVRTGLLLSAAVLLMAALILPFQREVVYEK